MEAGEVEGEVEVLERLGRVGHGVDGGVCYYLIGTELFVS